MTSGGIRIGRLFGINIFIDWSWVFIFLLVTWNLAVGVFPRLHPNWGAGLSWIVGLSASLLFFASVLAHELAHSLVARARGLPVRRITLFLFGGVSNIEREPPSAATEFLMAIVGPLTSIVLGLIFLVLGVLTAGGLGGGPIQALSRLSPTSTLLLWLGPVNIFVGVFNLIPGFPLDGGRVLRSALWAASGNLVRSTRWAAWAGQAIGWLLILVGIAMVFGARIPLLGQGFISGLWLAFIGWFLNNAAAQSYRQVVIQDLLEDVTVSRLVRAESTTVPPDISLTTLAYDYMIQADERDLPVVENDRMVGMVTLDNVRQAPRDQWGTITARQIMTPVGELPAVTPRQDVASALNVLGRHHISQVPVLEGDRLVGLLHRRDIMRWLRLHSDLLEG